MHRQPRHLSVGGDVINAVSLSSARDESHPQEGDERGRNHGEMNGMRLREKVCVESF